MIKAVIFDLDGTLLNTLEDLTRACNFAISKFGYEKIDVEDTRNYIGNGIRNYILKATSNDMEHIDEMFALFKEYYAPHCNDYTEPYPGIVEVTDRFMRDGYHLGCVSNKAMYALTLLCESHFKDRFEVILGDQCEFKRKPDPEILREAAGRVGASMNEVVYVGDSDVDVLTVRNAGCHGIFVSYGYRDKKILENLGAEIIVDFPRDIYNKVKEMDIRD